MLCPTSASPRSSLMTKVSFTWSLGSRPHDSYFLVLMDSRPDLIRQDVGTIMLMGLSVLWHKCKCTSPPSPQSRPNFQPLENTSRKLVCSQTKVPLSHQKLLLLLLLKYCFYCSASFPENISFPGWRCHFCGRSSGQWSLFPYEKMETDTVKEEVQSAVPFICVTMVINCTAPSRTLIGWRGFHLAHKSPTYGLFLLHVPSSHSLHSPLQWKIKILGILIKKL